MTETSLVHVENYNSTLKHNSRANVSKTFKNLLLCFAVELLIMLHAHSMIRIESMPSSWSVNLMVWTQFNPAQV